MQLKAPVRFTATTWSQSEGSIFARPLTTVLIPALFTSRLTAPNRSRIRSNTPATCVRDETSHEQARTRSPGN